MYISTPKRTEVPAIFFCCMAVKEVDAESQKKVQNNVKTREEMERKFVEKITRETH